MKKKFVHYIVLLFIVASIFAGLCIFNDTKENGFFTISQTEKVRINTERNISEVRFRSKNDHLGIINLNLDIFADGKFVFRLKELRSSNWYYENTFSAKQLRGLTYYPFGFPTIVESKDKEYIIQIESLEKARIAFHSTGNETQLIVKYVIPKTALLQSRQNFISFGIQKIRTVLLGNTTWVVYSIISYCVLAFILYSGTNKRSQSEYIRLVSIPEKSFTVKGWFSLSIFSLLLIYYALISTNPSGTLLLATATFWIFTLIYNRFDSTTSFKAAVSLLVIVLLLVMVGLPQLSEKLAVWVWIFLAIGAFHTVLSQLSIREITSRFHMGRINFIFKKNKSWIPFLLFIFVIMISASVHTYILGGDDSRLYYVYPLEYYQNLVSKVGPDASPSALVSFLPPTSIAHFIFMLIGLKFLLPFVNLQMFLFLLNIICGFCFFYLLLGQVLRIEGEYARKIKLITSFMYVFSIFNFYTLLNSLLIPMYLLSAFPLSIYFIIKGIKERNSAYIAASAIVWTIFSFLSAAMPWMAGALIIVTPFLLVIFWEHKLLFVKYTTIFSIFLILLNFYWLLHIPYSSITNTSDQGNSSLVSSNFRRETEQSVRVGAGHNKVFYPLLNSFFYDIQKDFKWSQLSVYDSWYKYILPLNSVFPLVIFIAGLMIGPKEKQRKMYLVSLSSFILGVYLLTVNISNSLINLFLWLVLHIPGFVMFRNMFDKFPYALSLSYAILTAISLHIVVSNIKNTKLARGLLSYITIILLLNAIPFLKGDFLNLPIWTTEKSFNKISSLNSDYVALMEYIKNQPNASRYVWLPLAYGNIAQIPDNYNENYYYNGVSPQLMLSAKNDYSGELSFGSYGKELMENIMQRDFDKVGKRLQELNARYVVVNNNVSYDLQQSYIYSDGLINSQGEEFIQAIIGRKIKDFGKRYSLYEINQAYLNDKVYVTNNFTEIPKDIEANVAYKKVSSNEFQVTLRNIPEKTKLVLLDPYFANWSVYSADKKTALLTGKHARPFAYANGWDISIAQLKEKTSDATIITNPDGTYTLHLSLLFVFPSFFSYATILSLLTFIGLCLLIIVAVIKKRYERAKLVTRR